MDNPLFGSNVFSPPPAQGGFNNPIWSAGPKTDNAPNSARGMRRLGGLQPWELQTEQAPGYHGSVTSPLASAPGTSAAAAMGRDRPEESAFADALGRLVRGEADAAETIISYSDICRARAAELRDLASSQLQRAPRYMALSESAAELEAEATTWQLLWFLHGIPGADFPAGSGGDFVEGAGFAKTFRQLAADLMFQDEVLNRAGRAVAWLEASSAADDPEPEQGLARKDGVWQETKGKLAAGPSAHALGGSGGGALVTQLDPDATTRQKARLDIDNTKDEDRLVRMVWRLVRGGRIARAAAACEHAGQPWRAASLSGGGLHGPLPLGSAAEDADAADTGVRQTKILATEVESGTAVLRVLWRWACYQAAERITTTSQATGSGVHEAAIYAVFSSHIVRALPACATWEDALWVHLRCWLESAVDSELAASLPWDSVTAIPAEAVSDGAPQADIAAAAEGVSVISGGWPVSRIRDSLPSTFEDAVESGGALFGGARTATAGAHRFRRVQLDLILDKVESLVNDALVRWIIDGAAVAENNDTTTGEGPSCPPGLMRFAAHLALMFWSLGVASVPENPDPAAAYSQLHDRLQRLVQVYTVHLIDTGAHLLVHLYACHLRAGLRRSTYLLFLEQLLAAGDLEACRSAYLAGTERFKTLENSGDVAEGEMSIIARKAAGKAQMESLGGPLQRARSLVWLCFEEDSYVDAVRWACILCREFALGGACGAAAAVALLGEVLPEGVGRNDKISLDGMVAAEEAMNPVERLLAAAESTAGGAGEEAAELRAWMRFFELEIEFSSWEAVYEAAVHEMQSSGQDPSGGGLADLARDTVPLLTAAVDFLKEGPCPWLASSSRGYGAEGAAASPAGEVAIVVGPDYGINTDALILSGDAYPTFTSVEEQSSVAAATAAALRAAAGASALTFHAGPAPEEGSVHLPGLVSLAVDCRDDDIAQNQAAALLSLVLKGGLQAPDGSVLEPLLATNVSASPAVVAYLCRSAVYPRIALKAAVLRQALAFMGHEGDEGGDIVPEVVASDATIGLFAPHEAREIKELEAATATQKKNRRQAQQAREQEEMEEQ
jgi:hypothetical protein